MSPDDRALLEQHIKGIQTALDGLPWQYASLPEDEASWNNQGNNCTATGRVRGGFFLRPKPKPRVLPWTRGNNLEGRTVTRKDDPSASLEIIDSGSHYVILVTPVGRMIFSYEEMLAGFVMRDGSPCGTAETGK